MRRSVTLGATPLAGGRCHFCVWAPRAERVEVRLVGLQERLLPLKQGEGGYFHGGHDAVGPGSLYFYRLDGVKDRPDPASRFQPEGVHGPSQVVSPHFPWEDQGWFGPALRDYVIYELHVGVFTPQGTFDAIISYLEELKALGITALELMPVAQFSGERNWGYDGAYPFAVQNTYGGPEGLKRLVNACHRLGLAVVLDVVYNHLGPEGNYLGDYGGYFTDHYRTPWGDAVNYDRAHSDEVRRFFLENARYWITDCHIDALRLDGLHAIIDQSAQPFLAQLAQTVHEQGERLGRRVYLIAESDHNDARLIRAPELGGYGLDAHWNDDFHHAVHTLLTGEQAGYYQDFGRLEQLAKAFREGFIYSGQYSPYRRRRHGSPARDLPAHRFVVFAQNHDQAGNRPAGERLSRLVSSEALKLAAGVIILSPFLPLLFMGEEYGEVAPFHYFVSYQDQDLVEAVRRGRREEFSAFAWAADLPDPQSEETYLSAKLNHELRRLEKHRVLWEFYQELLRFRREALSFPGNGPATLEVNHCETEKVLLVRRAGGSREVTMVCNFHASSRSLALPWRPGAWDKLLDSAEGRWGGPGSPAPPVLQGGEEVSLTLAPYSLVLFVRREDEA